MLMNATKTKFINFTLGKSWKYENKIKYHKLGCNMRGDCECHTIEQTETIKYLGVTYDEYISWKPHIQNTRKKLLGILAKFKQAAQLMPKHFLKMIYYALAHSVLTYGIVVWGGTYVSNLKALSTLQKSFIRIMCKKPRDHPSHELFVALKIPNLKRQFCITTCTLMYKHYKSLQLDRYINKKITRTQNEVLLEIPFTYMTGIQKSTLVLAPKIFNWLPNYLREIIVGKKLSINVVKSKLKKLFISPVNDDSLIANIF